MFLSREIRLLQSSSAHWLQPLGLHPGDLLQLYFRQFEALEAE